MQTLIRVLRQNCFIINSLYDPLQGVVLNHWYSLCHVSAQSHIVSGPTGGPQLHYFMRGEVPAGLIVCAKKEVRDRRAEAAGNVLRFLVVQLDTREPAATCLLVLKLGSKCWCLVKLVLSNRTFCDGLNR